MFAAWRDRVPGRYELSLGVHPFKKSVTQWVIVVDDDGAVRATYNDGYDLQCTSALTEMWHPTIACELGDPQLFDECLALDSLCQSETCWPPDDTLAGWLVDCVDVAPSCP